MRKWRRPRDARAQFYVVQPERDLGGTGGVSTALFGGSTNPQVGLEHLAGVTGTQVLKIGTTNGSLLSRVTRETSAHYLVSFDADPTDRRPGSHRVDLKASRPDVTLRVRPTLSRAVTADTASAAKTPHDTLRDAQPYRDLAMRAATFVSRTPDQKVMIVATIEPLDPSVKLNTVVAGLYSGTRLIAEWTAKPGSAKLPVRAGLAAAPGTYRLRVAARDLAGKLGASTPTSPPTAKRRAAEPSSLVLGAPARAAFHASSEFTNDRR